MICFSPRHDLTLAEMPGSALVEVVDTWAAETAALGQRYRWVQVFENKGAVMGCSNPHPHGQIWAFNALPTEPAAEDRQQRAYFEAHGSPLLVDYAARERALGERVVYENDLLPGRGSLLGDLAVRDLDPAAPPRGALPDLSPLSGAG